MATINVHAWHETVIPSLKLFTYNSTKWALLRVGNDDISIFLNDEQFNAFSALEEKINDALSFQEVKS
jgi:hypothetical protein